MKIKHRNYWLPLILFTGAGIVLTILASITPAKARDNGTWTQPYTGSFSTTGNVFSVTNSGTGIAINALAGSAEAILAQSTSGDAIEAGSTSGNGVYGASGSSAGVSGYSTSAAGVYGYTAHSSQAGVYGYTTTAGYGVYGQCDSSTGYGGYFDATSGSGGTGVFGEGATTGVYGESTASNSSGVYGISSASGASGVYGSESSGSGSGVYGYASGSGNGVYAYSSSGTGIYAVGGTVAGHFAGSVQIDSDLNVDGTIMKGEDDFEIDHPLDPANKFLVHSCVESNELMNIYRGTVVLDSDGRATVAMPSWFEAENKDINYQLTCIGEPATIYVSREMQNNRFEISGTSGLKVCWVVTGDRQDAYAKSHPLVVEEQKPASERGKYRNPVELGMPVTLGIHYTPPHKMSVPLVRPRAPQLNTSILPKLPITGERGQAINVTR